MRVCAVRAKVIWSTPARFTWISKIQFEQTDKRQDFLQKPSDWLKLALRKVDFHEPILHTLHKLVQGSRK